MAAFKIGTYAVAASVDVPNPFGPGPDHDTWALCYERGRQRKLEDLQDQKRRRQARQAFYRAHPELAGKTFLETIRLY